MLYHFKIQQKNHLIIYLYLYLGSYFSNYLPFTNYRYHFRRFSCLFLLVNCSYYL